MGKSKKKDKSEKINFLRQQYEAFLEDDRKRRERNEYILKRLDNMRTCAVSPNINDPATVKMNAASIFAETSKMAVQTRPPLFRNTLLQNHTTIIPHQFSQHQMAISKDTTQNNIEQTILKEIRKKYILIPKLPSQFYVESEINEPTPQPKIDPIDNEWRTKYDILEKLNCIDDDDNKSFKETSNEKADKKLNKNISLFGDKRKEDQDRIFINSKISRVDDPQTVRISKEEYHPDNPIRIEDTSKESYSNNNTELFDNNMNTNNQRDGDVVLVINNAVNNKIENYDYKPEEMPVTDEKYDKDIDSEKSKINNFNVYDQPLNSKNIIDSIEIENSPSFRELKHPPDPIQNKHQPKLETVAPALYTDPYPISAPEVEVEKHYNNDAQIRGMSLTESGNQADKNSELVIRASEHNTFSQNDQPPSQVAHQLSAQENKEMSETRSETKKNEISTTLHQNNVHDQGWNEDQPIYQSPIENYEQVYNQDATELYENQAHPEQTHEQNYYRGIVSAQNNSDPSQAYPTSQYEQGPNQNVVLSQQLSSAAPNQDQHNSEEQGNYLQNEQGQYEGQYFQSDKPQQYQEDIGQNQYLSNDQQSHYVQDNETSQYLQSGEHVQYLQPDRLEQDTGQYLSNDEQGHYQQNNEQGQYLQSDENGQYQEPDGPKQDTGQEQYLSNDEQGPYHQDNVPGQYLQSAEHGQYQQPNIQTEGQPLPDNGELQFDGQYQNSDGQGQYQQENVQGEYLQNVVQYPQPEGLEQYPQNYEQDQYLPNDGQIQFEGQYQYETDPNYTQQQYAEYSGHELASTDGQQALMERDQQPASNDIQPSVDNITAQ